MSITKPVIGSFNASKMRITESTILTATKIPLDRDRTCERKKIMAFASKE